MREESSRRKEGTRTSIGDAWSGTSRTSRLHAAGKAFLLLLAAVIAPPASAASAADIPVTDSNVRKGLSPYNWIVKDDMLVSSIAGASLTVKFKGTSHVTIKLDSPMAPRKVASKIPTLAWTVNGGELKTYQCGLDEKSVVLVDGVSDPVIDLYIKGMTISERRWDAGIPINSLQILGFTVDDGCVTEAVPMPEKVWLNIGDSMMTGDCTVPKPNGEKPEGFPIAGDARVSYAYLLARHFGCRESRLATWDYNWTGGRAAMPPLTTLIDQHAGTISRLTDGVLSPAPAVVFINLGAICVWVREKGVPPQEFVVEALQKVRSRAGKDAKIIVMLPFVGPESHDVIKRAFEEYQKAEHDGAAHLIDPGTLDYEKCGKELQLGSTCDPKFGLVPSREGHRMIYEAVLPSVEAVVRPAR